MERQYNRNTKGHKGAAVAAAFAAVCIALLAACSSINCPINNRVYTKYSLRTPEGKVDTLRMNCTVSTNRTDGSDSVIINRDTLMVAMMLPISNANPSDTFFVELSSEALAFSSLDTIVVSKEDFMHFEAPECAASYFHNITGVTTTHHAIDSVTIKTPGVTYDTSKNHFYIYFTPRD